MASSLGVEEVSVPVRFSGAEMLCMEAFHGICRTMYGKIRRREAKRERLAMGMAAEQAGVEHHAEKKDGRRTKL